MGELKRYLEGKGPKPRWMTVATPSKASPPPQALEALEAATSIETQKKQKQDEETTESKDTN